MNFRLFTGIVTLGCVLLASCYPYNEQANQKRATKPPQKTAAKADAQKLKEQEELKNKEQEEPKQGTNTDENPDSTTPPGEKSKPPVEAKRDYPFANKVPGKEGFVFSPYNNKVVDVRDIPSGTLVQDPTYPAAEKKYFRVP